MKNFGVKSNAADVIFTNVTKVYGQNSVAVDQISFNVKAGELMTLLGPSGCGKTTTLRMIAGLEAATSGTIVIGDSDVTNRPASDRDVSMVFQSYALFPHKTVFENVCYGLIFSGLSKTDAEEKAKSEVDKFRKEKRKATLIQNPIQKGLQTSTQTTSRRKEPSHSRCCFL